MIEYSNQQTNNNNTFLTKKRNISIPSNENTLLLQNKKSKLSDTLNKTINSNATGHFSDLLPSKINFKHSFTMKGGEIIKSNQILSQKIENSQGDCKEYSHFPLFLNRNIGRGLNNVGNTCFLNSSLQVLFHTIPFVNFFLSPQVEKRHSSLCSSMKLNQKGNCLLCKFEQSISISLSSSKDNPSTSFTPSSIIQNIKAISKHLKIGRQEDAHEFIVKLLESLESSLKDDSSEEILNNKDYFIRNNSQIKPNFINKTFNFEVNSIVECGFCRFKSENVQYTNHLSIDLMNSDSIHQCITNFLKPDFLIKDNKYFCGKCNLKRDSSKRFAFKTCK